MWISLFQRLQTRLWTAGAAAAGVFLLQYVRVAFPACTLVCVYTPLFICACSQCNSAKRQSDKIYTAGHRCARQNCIVQTTCFCIVCQIRMCCFLQRRSWRWVARTLKAASANWHTQSPLCSKPKNFARRSKSGAKRISRHSLTLIQFNSPLFWLSVPNFWLIWNCTRKKRHGIVFTHSLSSACVFLHPGDIYSYTLMGARKSWWLFYTAFISSL